MCRTRPPAAFWPRLPSAAPLTSAALDGAGADAAGLRVCSGHAEHATQSAFALRPGLALRSACL
eukprot:9898045-Alexandrium_andersonii.AAC.1